MLQPEDRKLLVQSLNPPTDYVFDTGVVTTFSLQPEALIAAPLHLSWLAHGGDSEMPDDPIRLLEGLRRVASRLTIFSDAGRMYLPTKSLPLAGLLEDMIHEVRAPRKGAFHPKAWLLRFQHVEKKDAPHLRLLVLSRNLTFDRSWDLCLGLEGSPGKQGVAKNAPLRELFSGVLQLTAQGGRKLSTARLEALESLMEDARRVNWILPPGFDEWEFHALGLSTRPKPWLPEKSDDLLVISPFVSKQALEDLADTTRQKPVLISRPDELDQIPDATLARFREVRVLDERCDQLTEEDVGGDTLLQGLHAKAFISKIGWKAKFVVGSANATNAALRAGSNVEFLCALTGRYSQTSTPEKILGSEGFGPILVPYERSDRQVDPGELKVRETLEGMRNLLADSMLQGACSANGPGVWKVSLTGLPIDLSSGVELHVWPVTQLSSQAVDCTGQASMEFSPLAAAEVTAIFGFRLSLDGQEESFARAIPLSGSPPEREAEILMRILRNPNGFLRYLRLLLEELSGAGSGEGMPPWFHAGTAGGSAVEDSPFFEMLAKAYSRNPDSLKSIDDLVRRLEGSQGQDQVIPPEFREMWDTFRTALLSAEESP